MSYLNLFRQNYLRFFACSFAYTPIIYIVLTIFFSISDAHAFSWQDLWKTRDQQAKIMMDKGQYTEAQKTFSSEEWRATAAFRARNYQQAASLYARANNAESYYNVGNAFANIQKYEQAIKAYDKAISMNHNHQDASYNRQIVSDLLKKQQQNKENDSRQNQSNDQQNLDNSQQKNASDKNQNLDKDKVKSQSKNSNKTSDENQQKNNQDNPSNDTKQQKPQEEKSSDNDSQQKKPQVKSALDKAKQEDGDQWLRLIPDDPGGLLREKFLRDYVRRQGNV